MAFIKLMFYRFYKIVSAGNPLFIHYRIYRRMLAIGLNQYKALDGTDTSGGDEI